MRKPALLGALACTVTAAGGYLLLISPQATATSDLRTELADVRTANEASARQIPALKAQLEDIAGDVQALRALSQQVPPAIDLQTLYAELDAVAAQVGDGVHVTNVSVTVPSLLTVEGAEQPAPEADPATPEPTGDDTEATSAVTADAAVLATYEVTMTVEANPAQAAAFIEALGQTKRLNVVSNSAIAGGADDEGGSVNVTASFYLQQVDVDGLAERIESLAAEHGTAPTTTPAPDAAADEDVQQTPPS